MTKQAQFQRVRAREFGISIGTLSPGPLNALFAAQSIDSLDGNLVDALPLHEAIAILQQWRRGR